MIPLAIHLCGIDTEYEPRLTTRNLPICVRGNLWVSPKFLWGNHYQQKRGTRDAKSMGTHTHTAKTSQKRAGCTRLKRATLHAKSCQGPYQIFKRGEEGVALVGEKLTITSTRPNLTTQIFFSPSLPISHSNADFWAIFGYLICTQEDPHPPETLS